jgi:hypothetical protein
MRAAMSKAVSKHTEAISGAGIRRSAAVRDRRRKSRAHSYRGKDKQAVIKRLTADQGGRCAVCGGLGCELGNGSSGLVLDHCHASGKPRAMLCTRCNAALGLMREDQDAILQLAQYAEAWSKRSGK